MAIVKNPGGDHNSWFTDPNFMFVGANCIVLMRLTDKNKTKTSISRLSYSLPLFTFSHQNWAYVLGVAISKKNHQFSLISAKYFSSWSLDSISKFLLFFYSYWEIQLWTRAISPVVGWIFTPNQFWGVPWDVKSLKTQILMAQGSPLQETSPKEGPFFVDPFWVHRTRSGSTGI